ncbi:hypothetical protein CDL12_08060 [Handroanthus impetiginosus]|uniref:GPI mannosyltransferase 1 n=1 Tax=Handroanthus impetiginosus TaxID=429701 RepID=A0A2G9HP13_9LAMI|nr:hypothetical protein CDL12_08060 [Handroanthus impetiginosus]
MYRSSRLGSVFATLGAVHQMTRKVTMHFQPGKKPVLVDWNSRTSKSSWDSSNTKITNPRHIWNFFTSMITWRRVMLGIISGSTFFSLTGFCFYLYGWDFLNEALLYHLTLQLVLIYPFAFDLPFCLLLQTLTFVAFNEVVTAQYFVWFFCLLPLMLPWSSMKLKWKDVASIFLWIGAQTHWLMWASLLFMAANTFVIVNIIRSHVYCPLFKQFQASSSKAMKDD